MQNPWNKLLILVIALQLPGCDDEQNRDKNSVTVSMTTVTQSTPTVDPEEINLPPQISGIPERVTLYATRTYTLKPTAYDPENDSLKFFISGDIPSWVTFNEDSGEIHAAPTVNSIGSEYEITVSVSDGKNTSFLQPFIIAVSTGLDTVLISWTPPTQNEDGSVLKDLAGYRIYYGSNTEKYENLIEIDSIETTDYLIEDLPLPEYFFVMTAVDIYDNESAYSNVINKRVD